MKSAPVPARYSLPIVNCCIAALLHFFSAAAHAEPDFASRAKYVEPTGGQVANYGRVENFTIDPELIAPGQTVKVTIAFSMLTDYSDSREAARFLNVNAYGEWWPYVELASIVNTQLKITVPPRTEKTFVFQAPLDPGYHKVRIFWIDNDRPIRSFFGGVAKPGQFDTEPNMWTQVEFKVAPIAGGVSQVILPSQIEQPKQAQSVYFPVGADLCDPANYVRPVNGIKGEYMRFDQNLIYPQTIYPGDDVTVILRFTNLDLEHMNSRLNAAVFGNWSQEALGKIVVNERRSDMPVTMIKSVRFKAPPKAGKYKIRWLAADNKGMPATFNGGFDQAGLQKTGPDIWTEFEMDVSPRPEELTMAPEEVDIAGLVSVDYMPDQTRVDPIQGKFQNYLEFTSFEIAPDPPAADKQMTLTVRIKNLSGKSPDKLYLEALGDWAPRTVIGRLIDGVAKADLGKDVEQKISFTAPSSPGDYRVRLILMTEDNASVDFFGRPLRGRDARVKCWTEIPFTVPGEKKRALSPKEELLEYVRRALREGLPVIEHRPIRRAAEKINLPVFVTIISRAAITDADLHFRHSGDYEFTRIPLKPEEGKRYNRQTFSATFPAEKMAPEGFEYFVHVKDAEGHEVTLPFHKPREHPIEALVTNDFDPPQFTEQVPAAGAVVNDAQPVISFIAFEDPPKKSYGVDVQTVRIAIDGQEIYPSAVPLEYSYGVLTRAQFTVRPAERLANGEHAITVRVKDYAGNVGQITDWKITVNAPQLAADKYKVAGSYTVASTHLEGNQPGYTGGGWTHTNTMNFTAIGPLSKNITLDASTTANLNMYFVRPDNPNTEQFGEYHMSFESAKVKMTAGDGYVLMPSLITSQATFRGLSLKQKVTDRLELYEAYEFNTRRSDPVAGVPVHNRRKAIRGKMKLKSTPSQVDLGVSGLDTLNKSLDPANDSPAIPYRSQGRVFGFDLAWQMPKGHRLTMEMAQSRESVINTDTWRIRRAYKADFSGMILGASLSANWNYALPDFGKVVQASASQDNKGWSVNGSRSILRGQLPISLSYSKNHDRVDRRSTPTYRTKRDNFSVSTSASFPKLASISFSFSEANTNTDQDTQGQFKATFNRTKTFNYTFTPTWQIPWPGKLKVFNTLKVTSVARSRSLYVDKTKNRTNYQTDGWTLSAGWNPDDWLSFTYTYSPSVTHNDSTATAAERWSWSRSKTRGVTVKVPKTALTLTANQTISRSEISDNSSKTYSNNRTFTLSLPAFKTPDGIVSHTFSFTYQYNHFDDRRTETSDKIDRTLLCNYNTRF